MTDHQISLVEEFLLAPPAKGAARAPRAAAAK